MGAVGGGTNAGRLCGAQLNNSCYPPSMHRRTFLSTLAALASAPALPARATATATADQFARAKMLARCHDTASPQMLARLMQLDDATARGLFNMLRDHNVIGLGADGMTRAIAPLNGHCITNEALRIRRFAEAAFKLHKRLKDVTDRLTKPDEDPNVPDTDAPAPDAT